LIDDEGVGEGVGVGVGVTIGVGVGVGVGVGLALWAWADVDATATNHVKASVAMRPRLVAIFAGCNSLDEACIKFIPGNKRRSAKKIHAD
jgi:hypothetical protein